MAMPWSKYAAIPAVERFETMVGNNVEFASYVFLARYWRQTSFYVANRFIPVCKEF
jgi:hypothetical protein